MGYYDRAVDYFLKKKMMHPSVGGIDHSSGVMHCCITTIDYGSAMMQQSEALIDHGSAIMQPIFYKNSKGDCYSKPF